ncbi:MAG: DUF3575 domain-containing protein [Candidatus Cryptobacteroides sp.]
MAVVVPSFAGAEVAGGKKGGEEPVQPFIDRWAFKTNVFEWVLTIPNIGVEFDLVNSPYNTMTIGLNAKYNWNTYHSLAPSTVFNILDVRPEFRYYYRTRERIPRDPNDTTKLSAREWFKDRIFTDQRKNARPWRAQYIGAYANYGSYTLKFGKTGYQGYVVGLGATAGYGLPMYQYKNGAIDVELGFSVGLQFATREQFTHSADGNYYIKDWENSKGMHFTPFPVISELKVAFVWRHKSIKDKVQEDKEKKKQMERLERAKAQVETPFIDARAKFDEQLGWTMDKPDIEKLQSDKEKYREMFINDYITSEVNTLYEVTIPNQLIDDQLKDKLRARVEVLKEKAIKEFDKSIGYTGKPDKAKAPKQAKPAKAKADKQTKPVKTKEKQTPPVMSSEAETSAPKAAKPAKTKAPKQAKPAQAKAEKQTKSVKTKEKQTPPVMSSEVETSSPKAAKPAKTKAEKPAKKAKKN